MQHFWSLVLPEQDDKPADLYLEGEIASETWYGDEVTPAQFRADLARAAGRDVTVWINSPGGDVFAASMIYTALMEHKGGVTVKIEGLAASAASVIAMAGDTVYMAPTAYLMIHNPWTVAVGDAEDMRHEADVLEEIAEGLVLAYQIKTGLSRSKLRQMMADETWMSAQTAIDQGFADRLMTRAESDPPGRPDEEDDDDRAGDRAVDRAHSLYGRIAACARLRQRIAAAAPGKPVDNDATPAGQAARDAFVARLRDAERKINHN